MTQLYKKINPKERGFIFLWYRLLCAYRTRRKACKQRKKPSFKRGPYNLVRAALRLSDQHYTRIEGKIAKNNLVIYANFCYSQKKKEDVCHF